MWIDIWNLFREYSGNGLAMGLFGLAVLYLFFTEKEKGKRILLIYVTIIVLALFFCPLFIGFLQLYMDGEIIYRILWLMPMTLVIAYASNKLLQSLKNKWMKAIAGVVMIAVLVVTGDYVYDNPYFSKAENRFHVTTLTKDVCDSIIVEGREVRAVFPSEMLAYVRQYTANICMPYGRDLVVEKWITDNPLYDAMEERPVNCVKVASLAAEQDCHYIIIHEGTEKSGDFANTEYALDKTVDGFQIYLRKGSNLTLVRE